MLFRDGNLMYQREQIGSAEIVTLFDYYYHAVVDYIDSAVYITIRNYIGQVANEYSGSIPVTINGVDQTINVSAGVGSVGLVSEWIDVETKSTDVKNGSLSLGSKPTPPDRFEELEQAQAELLFMLIEKGVL